MRGAFFVAWRSVIGAPVRNGLLVGAVTLLALLPVALARLVDHYERTLLERARSTPLVVGATGSAFSLLFASLYFRGEVDETMSAADLAKIEASIGEPVIPLVLGERVDDAPLVGTTVDYFDFHDLTPVSGRAFALLGEAVVGHAFAERYQTKVGDIVRTSPSRIYDLAASYPTDLQVVGVLGPTGEADDEAVFVDHRTAWIAAGIGHGHDDVESDPAYVLDKTDGTVTANAALPEKPRVTRESWGDFHLHGGPEFWPISAVIVDVRDSRMRRTQVAAKIDLASGLHSIRPERTTNEVLGFVSKAQRFFDANLGLTAAATALLLAVIVLLTTRLRRHELRTLSRLGAARRWVVGVLAIEFGFVVVTGFVIAVGLGIGLAELIAASGWIL